MAYIKPSVLVYQELESAGGVANVTPDLGVVIFGPLYNVVRVDTTSESSLTETQGASSTDIAADLEETVANGPTGLRIDLKNTKPGQLVDQDSLSVIGTNVYVNTFGFSVDVGITATTEFDGDTFRSKVTLWDTVSDAYYQTYSPTNATPEATLPDGSGTHVRVGDKITFTYLNPDYAGGVTGVTVTATDATFTSTTNHNLKVGDRVDVSNCSVSGVDGQYTVTESSLLTFKVVGDFATTGSDTSVDISKIDTLTTTITKVESAVSSGGSNVTKSITIAKPVPTFVASGAVLATVKIFRFYDQMVIPSQYVDGINTLEQFDLDTADDDYIWLLADLDPPFDAVGPAAYETVEFGTPTDYRIMSGNFHVAYKALRQDKYSTIITINSTAELESELGEATEDNPLALGVKIASDNTTTSVMAVSLKKEDDGNLGWARALELVENQRNAYALVPLTQETSVLAAFKAHVEQMSTPENASWRVAIVNTAVPTTKDILVANAAAPVTTGTTELVSTTLYLKDIAHQNGSAQDTGEFIGSGVTPGDVVVVTAVTGATINEETANVATATAGEFYKNIGTSTITVGTNNVSVLVGGFARGTTGGAAQASVDPETLKSSWVVDEVTNSNYLKLDEFDGMTSLGGLGITYYIYRDLTRTEQASAVASASGVFASNRVWHIFPDTVGVNVGGQVKYLPGYYLAAGHGGMTAGFPAQQGFTNISVAGIEDLRNSNFYFRKEELNLMAEMGTCIYVQESQGGLPYCRHSITTDMSVLEYREQVKVKNWDFLSFYYYDKMKPFIGQWNITPDTLSNMKQTLIAASELLQTQKLPRIGAPLLSYEEPTVVQNAVNKDMVDVRLKIETVTPNNYTNIYLVI